MQKISASIIMKDHEKRSNLESANVGGDIMQKDTATNTTSNTTEEKQEQQVQIRRCETCKLFMMCFMPDFYPTEPPFNREISELAKDCLINGYRHWMEKEEEDPKEEINLKKAFLIDLALMAVLIAFVVCLFLFLPKQ